MIGHTILYLKAKEYIPGEIDYVLLPNKNNYLIDDIIDTEVNSKILKMFL